MWSWNKVSDKNVSHLGILKLSIKPTRDFDPVSTVERRVEPIAAVTLWHPKSKCSYFNTRQPSCLTADRVSRNSRLRFSITLLSFATRRQSGELIGNFYYVLSVSPHQLRLPCRSLLFRVLFYTSLCRAGCFITSNLRHNKLISPFICCFLTMMPTAQSPSSLWHW